MIITQDGTQGTTVFLSKKEALRIIEKLANSISEPPNSFSEAAIHRVDREGKKLQNFPSHIRFHVRDYPEGI